MGKKKGTAQEGGRKKTTRASRKGLERKGKRFSTSRGNAEKEGKEKVSVRDRVRERDREGGVKRRKGPLVGNEKKLEGKRET